MGSRDLEEDVYEFLQRVQLEQFFDKVHHRLHLTRLSHFDHVTEEDLTEINMSKPEQRRLFDALKKLKKRSVLSRLSFKVCKRRGKVLGLYSGFVVKKSDTKFSIRKCEFISSIELLFKLCVYLGVKLLNNNQSVQQ